MYIYIYIILSHIVSFHTATKKGQEIPKIFNGETFLYG